jgi:hypothetical protein
VELGRNENRTREIWGWKEQEEVEKVQEKYLKGVLGVDKVLEEQAESESGKESGKVWR